MIVVTLGEHGKFGCEISVALFDTKELALKAIRKYMKRNDRNAFKTYFSDKDEEVDQIYERIKQDGIKCEIKDGLIRVEEVEPNPDGLMLGKQSELYIQTKCYDPFDYDSPYERD